MNNTKIIAFDADDTLWENENFYRNTEEQFCSLMSDYMSKDVLSQELLKTEMSNIDLYGYGVKSFVLSMIETAIKISFDKVDNKMISSIIEIGKNLIDMPINLLDGVSEILPALQKSYTLVLATKGDLLDQQRKLQKSGLEIYFHHIEIMSQKRKADYMAIIKKLGIEPNEFLMVGNTIKSDIIPVIEAGGKAIHIPFYLTWEHEKVIENDAEYIKIDRIEELRRILL
jgi:putative hydrolase of the HAD superfamily